MRLVGAAENLIPFNYGAMTLDSNGDGVVDGFTRNELNATSVFALHDGQEITLANVINANGLSGLYLTNLFAVSPNIIHIFSVDAALVRSGAEAIVFYVSWYTAADVSISSNSSPEINPGAIYSRQSLTGTSPATAAKARIYARVFAKAIGATGVVKFKDALFQAV